MLSGHILLILREPEHARGFPGKGLLMATGMMRIILGCLYPYLCTQTCCVEKRRQGLL